MLGGITKVDAIRGGGGMAIPPTMGEDAKGAVSRTGVGTGVTGCGGATTLTSMVAPDISSSVLFIYGGRGGGGEGLGG